MRTAVTRLPFCPGLAPVLLSVLLAGSAAADPLDQWRLTRVASGLDVTRLETSLGSEATVVSVPLAVTVDSPSWTASVRSSYLWLTGGDYESARQGVGDTTLTLGYRLRPWRADDVSLTLSGFAKLPTAEGGLGTGRADAGLQLEAAASLGRWVPFTTVSYRVPGRKDGFAMRDAWSLSAGGQYVFREGHAAGAYVLLRQSVFRTLDNYQDLVGYGSVRLSDRWSLMAYGSAGFGRRSGDLGGGLHLRFTPR